MELLPVLILPLLLVIAAMSDIATMTIPNWISGVLVVSFLALGLVFRMPMNEVAQAMGVGAGFLVAGMALFALGWLGGGDAKLMAATAVWFGWPSVLTFTFSTLIAGGAATLILLAFRRVQLPQPVLSVPWVGRLHSASEALPYGVAIAAGGLVALSQSPLIGLMAG